MHAAQDRLGPDVWSRIVQVKNTGDRTRYPRQFYALVFEAGGLLWFYSDSDGTRSFSLHYHNLAVEKHDFAPLLRAIDPGFTSFAVLPGHSEPITPPPGGLLPNGCFIDNYVALRERIASGEPIERARLLVLYYTVGTSVHGHTVLVYHTPRGTFVLDATDTDRPAAQLSRHVSNDPLAVARQARPELDITRARWVPTELPHAVLPLADLGNPFRHVH